MTIISLKFVDDDGNIPHGEFALNAKNQVIRLVNNPENGDRYWFPVNLKPILEVSDGEE